MKPTESELEVLQILWSMGPATVREVNDKLNDNAEREIGYTTTLKIMQLMLDKGLLLRDTSQRTHVYSSAVEEQSMKRTLLNQFVDKTFRGSASQLVLEALGQHRASDDELEAIKQFIEKIEQNDKPKL